MCIYICVYKCNLLSLFSVFCMYKLMFSGMTTGYCITYWGLIPRKIILPFSASLTLPSSLSRAWSL